MLSKIWKHMCYAIFGMTALLAFNSAWAKDALMATVQESSAYTFDENGNPLSKGTYAIGTLKVYLVVVGTQWPATLLPPDGLQLDLAVRAGDKGQSTKYPVPIKLRQAGGDLTLAPIPATHNVTGVAWSSFSKIGITVPTAIRNNPVLNVDGTELVGNLQIEPTKTGKFLDTVTTLRIFAKLVHPDQVACLRTATFVSNNPMNRNLSSATDGLDFTWGYKNNGDWTWAVTPGNNQIQDNALVVNTCDVEQTYDVKLGLASGFQTKSPGNVVTSYVSQVANATTLPLIDPYTELKAAIANGDYPTGTDEGTQLCVPTNTLPGKYSQWLKADVELIETGFTSEAGIPAAGSTYSTFTSDVYDNNTACATAKDPAVTQGTAVVYVKSKTCGGPSVATCTPPAP